MLEERPKPDLALGPGKGGSQAEVPSAGEREMPSSVGPFDVEVMWVGEYGRIAVCRAQIDHDQIATFDLHARHLDIVEG